MEFTYSDCVKLMPEWNGQALDIRELKGGITNQLYRVTSGNGMDCVFRFYGKKTELFIVHIYIDSPFPASHKKQELL